MNSNQIPPNTLHGWSRNVKNHSKMVDGHYLEEWKYLYNLLINFCDLWHIDATQLSGPHWPLKFPEFKNARWS